MKFFINVHCSQIFRGIKCSKMCVRVLLSISFLVLNGYCNPLNPVLPVRQTVNGPVEGIEQISSLGQKYYSFRGVPFAEPPITGIDPYTNEVVDRRFKVCY